MGDFFPPDLGGQGGEESLYVEIVGNSDLNASTTQRSSCGYTSPEHDLAILHCGVLFSYSGFLLRVLVHCGIFVSTEVNPPPNSPLQDAAVQQIFSAPGVSCLSPVFSPIHSPLTPQGRGLGASSPLLPPSGSEQGVLCPVVGDPAVGEKHKYLQSTAKTAFGRGSDQDHAEQRMRTPRRANGPSAAPGFFVETVGACSYFLSRGLRGGKTDVVKNDSVFACIAGYKDGPASQVSARVVGFQDVKMKRPSFLHGLTTKKYEKAVFCNNVFLRWVRCCLLRAGAKDY